MRKTKKIRGAGEAGSILPVALHKGNIYFLFGKENSLEDSAKGWSDFGGGGENNDLPIDTAIREAAEESTGFLGNEDDIRKMVDKMGTYPFQIGTYHVHILLIPYDENLPTYYNNNHLFLWDKMDNKLLNETKLFEKIQIKWFSIKDMKKEKKEFRSFYQKIVDEIILHLPNIKKYINKNSGKIISKTKKIKAIKTIKSRKMKGG